MSGRKLNDSILYGRKETDAIEFQNIIWNPNWTDATDSNLNRIDMCFYGITIYFHREYWHAYFNWDNATAAAAAANDDDNNKKANKQTYEQHDFASLT